MKIKNLADLAGVSPSTVSKAFSGSHEVSEATRERIFAIARENGVFEKYDKNRFCKPVIAVICPEINSDYYNSIVTQFKKEIEERGGIMLLSISDFSAEKLEEMYSYYTAYAKVDGVILFSARLRSVDPGVLLIPTVCYTQSDSNFAIDAVKVDTTVALLDAILDLKKKGHTKIGFAGDPLTKIRQRDFCDAMHEAGLPVYEKYIKMSEARFEEAGVKMMREWLDEGDVPTAIVAAYDYIALGIFRVLREVGLRIPEDVAVVGYDDIPRAPYLYPALSSIRTPVKESCRMTVELMMKKIDDRYYSSHEDITLPAEYMSRESSGGQS